MITIDCLDYSGSKPEVHFHYGSIAMFAELDIGVVQPVVDWGTANGFDKDVEFTRDQYKELQRAINEYVNRNRTKNMRVHTWDEINQEWATQELFITRHDFLICWEDNPQIAGKDLCSLLKTGDDWRMEANCWTGPILSIEARNQLNQLAIVLICD